MNVIMLHVKNADSRYFKQMFELSFWLDHPRYRGEDVINDVVGSIKSIEPMNVEDDIDVLVVHDDHFMNVVPVSHDQELVMGLRFLIEEDNPAIVAHGLSDIRRAIPKSPDLPGSAEEATIEFIGGEEYFAAKIITGLGYGKEFSEVTILMPVDPDGQKKTLYQVQRINNDPKTGPNTAGEPKSFESQHEAIKFAYGLDNELSAGAVGAKKFLYGAVGKLRSVLWPKPQHEQRRPPKSDWAKDVGQRAAGTRLQRRRAS